MKILNFREQSQGTKVHALFDVEFEIKIPELDICCLLVCRNWKVLKSNDGRYFPVSPSFSEEPTPGQKKWVNYNELDPRFSRNIMNQIMKLLEPHLKPKEKEGDFSNLDIAF